MEALGGKSFGFKEQLFMMGSDLYDVGLPHASPELCSELPCSKVIYHPALTLVQRNCVIS